MLSEGGCGGRTDGGVETARQSSQLLRELGGKPPADTKLQYMAFRTDSGYVTMILRSKL